MNYNIHPLFVHFPIALLFVYSLIKILPLQAWFPRVAWRQIERVLLFIGVLGAFAALTTGGMAEELTHPNHQLVEMHSLFAGIATWLYVALLLGEIVTMADSLVVRYIPQRFVQSVRNVRDYLTIRFTAKIIALAGLIAISITGLLGGVIVYGPTADPIAGIVLQLLHITL